MTFHEKCDGDFFLIIPNNWADYATRGFVTGLGPALEVLRADGPNKLLGIWGISS